MGRRVYYRQQSVERMEICDGIQRDSDGTSPERTRPTVPLGTTVPRQRPPLRGGPDRDDSVYGGVLRDDTPTNGHIARGGRKRLRASGDYGRPIGTYLYVLQVPFWLLFLGGLFGVLSRAEGGGGALAVSVLGAGIAMIVIASMGALISAITPTIAQLGGTGPRSRP
jgi:hypothetical protein